MHAPASLRDRALLVAVPALAWATNYHPGVEWRRFVRGLAGRPPPSGPWLIVEHLLLYTTIPALAALVGWWWLSRRGLLAPVAESFRVRPASRTLGLGVASGVAVAVFVLAAMNLAGAPLHGPVLDGWGAIGNVASNMYEEIVFRGLILLALAAATGRGDVAVVLSSLWFAAIHEQYPLPFRAMIFATTAAVSWLRLRTGSLWTAWAAHQVSDVIADLFLG